jgi:glycerophosphoryl diester phosphodiesterase
MAPLVPGTTPPWVIGHRGASADFPENTLPAFDAALKAGADAIELDVQRSRDGVAVVWHDRTLRHAGLPLRRVAGLTLAELARLDAGAAHGAARDPAFRGVRIPTLDEVLGRYGGRLPLLIEVKLRGGRPAMERHRALAADVATTLARRGLLNATFVLSFGAYALDAARRAAPGVRCVLNTDTAPRPGPGLRRRLEGLSAICLNIRALLPDFVRAVHDAGRPVLVFTCDTPAEADRCLAAGVDGIISNRPAWLRGYLKAA